jgi:hypothetical protein
VIIDSGLWLGEVQPLGFEVTKSLPTLCFLFESGNRCLVTAFLKAVGNGRGRYGAMMRWETTPPLASDQLEMEAELGTVFGDPVAVFQGKDSDPRVVQCVNAWLTAEKGKPN